MDGISATNTFYFRSDALNVVDALSRDGVNRDGAELDELDGAEGVEERRKNENDFADAWK